jgi:ABC-type nitrate/sulfonate/bicarbonate transport system substrate-binding protein
VQLARACTRVVRPGRAVPRLGALLALLSLLFAATACHVGGSSSAGLAPGQDLTVAVVPGIDSVPLTVAARDRLFTQQGLGVSVEDFPSVDAAYTALTQGKVDVAAGDYTSFFYGIANGAPLALVADGYDAGTGTMQILTLPSSGITSPQDLAGKVVATPYAQVAPFSSTFPYSIDTLAAETVLNADGVNPTSIIWREKTQTQMISALKDGQVSAILVTEPLIIQAETELGAQEVLDACSGETANLPLSGYFTTQKFAKEHAAALGVFRTALSTAEADSAQRGVVQSVLLGEHMSTVESDLVNVGQYPTFVNVGQIQRIADLMIQSGMISAPISVQSLLVN